ncbi:hypothetical protein CLV56_2171 [Mumia flava]|uniref:Uncharacterized protein n=1 Tax=Mumia flava TaxID=1348852 RepID=A0A2M9BJ32_9ACTN|nr:hypothetical protein [Mumia flava]PJJ57932.1 hypothetical protein CLV56_2171 [Mumia flava]
MDSCIVCHRRAESAPDRATWAYERVGPLTRMTCAHCVRDQLDAIERRLDGERTLSG